MSPERGVPRMPSGTGMAPRVPGREHKPYRRFRDPSWTPEALGPIEPEPDERAVRMAEFARLRATGMPVWRAAERVDVSRVTGSVYERERLRRLRQEREAGDAA